MANYVIVKSQTRAKLADRILEQINQIGEDRVISIIMDEGGKFAGGTLMASSRAYIFYRDN